MAQAGRPSHKPTQGLRVVEVWKPSGGTQRPLTTTTATLCQPLAVVDGQARVALRGARSPGGSGQRTRDGRAPGRPRRRWRSSAPGWWRRARAHTTGRVRVSGSSPATARSSTRHRRIGFSDVDQEARSTRDDARGKGTIDDSDRAAEWPGRVADQGRAGFHVADHDCPHADQRPGADLKFWRMMAARPDVAG